jgi:integral membrane protein
MRNPIHFLRLVALWEAVSFLVLLGVAMPLKYIWHIPIAVKIVGSIHGVLFVTFCIALARAKSFAKWPLSRAALVFIAALFPFGPFLIDRRMKHWEKTSSTHPQS